MAAVLLKFPVMVMVVDLWDPVEAWTCPELFLPSWGMVMVVVASVSVFQGLHTSQLL